MIKIVTDSSALILLSKCNLIKKLCNSYHVIAPKSVISEVASDQLIKIYPDAKLIAELVSKQKIKMQALKKDKHKFPFALHPGEEDALLLAFSLPKAILATDDKKAIKAAKFLNIQFIITPKIIVDLFKLNKISYNEARRSIEKLSVIGRYSPDIIANALMALNEEI